jgi:NCS2 family nucleobase:cation symporter-2
LTAACRPQYLICNAEKIFHCTEPPFAPDRAPGERRPAHLGDRNDHLVRRHLVAGTVICIIGLSLGGADISLIAPTVVNGANVAEVSHVVLAGIVVLTIILISRLFRGFISQIAVLVSIVIGTIVAAFMGQAHFSNLSDVPWFGGPHIFLFGSPKFAAALIITMCIVMMVTFTNSFPDTAFAENVGLVGLTGVRSRWVVTTCGVLLLILGLIPKVGQIVADLPGPVIGGAATIMFSMVTAVGIQTLHKVRFTNNHNLLIVAISLAVGLIPSFDPHFYDKFPKNFQVIFGSSITATVIVVFVLNLVFNRWGAQDDGESAVQLAVDEGAVVHSSFGDSGGS